VVTCTATGTAAAGQYGNVGTATGTPPAGSGLTPPSDTDPSHYFGGTPGIDIEKATNGEDADSAPGPIVAVGSPVTWSYRVENTSNVVLTNVTVTDDQLVNDAVINCGEGTNNVIADLDPSEVVTCTATGTAAAGQYGNVGTATGTPPAGSGLTPPTDTDPSHYFGGSPALSLVKTATPTTYDAVGDTISYSYLVTNTSNVALAGPVTVVDDKATVTCPAGGLAPQASMTCTASYTITQADLNYGSVKNTAKATANGTDSNSDDETVTAVEPPVPIPTISTYGLALLALLVGLVGAGRARRMRR
jgi:uncharacterized repeat protein (TIGR01451 family)